MGLFSRKDDMPELPRIPTLPDMPKRATTASGLPTIPANTMHDSLNERLIKSAMEDETSDSHEQFEEETMTTHAPIDQNRSPRIPIPPRPMESTVPIGARPTRDTLFVKIDTFHTAQDTLHEIEQDIKELARDLQALKGVKAKELEELEAWDNELKKVNDRLSKIDTGIFGEV